MLPSNHFACNGNFARSPLLEGFIFHFSKIRTTKVNDAYLPSNWSHIFHGYEKIKQRKSRNNEIVSFRKLLCISSRLLPSLGWSRESPKSVTMIKRIEGLQRRATKLMLPNRSYNERLKRLALLPLVYRREVKDLSTFYKLKSGNFNCSFNSYFQFCSDERLRSHTSNKLKINRVWGRNILRERFLIGFHIYGTVSLMHWGQPTVVFLLLRD